MIRRLQSLRFLAAGLVLIGHIVMEMHQHGMSVPMEAALSRVPWGIGVDIFFVISGFIIATGSIDRPASLQSTVDFLVQRIIRIWPTYVIFTALMLVATVVVPSFLRHTTLTPEYIIASFAFFPWPRPGDGEFYPLLGQGWTLNYEMFFYVCFALVLLAPAKLRTFLLIACGGALVALGQWKDLPLQLGFYSKPVILEFLYGVTLCAVYRRVRTNPAIGAGLVLASVAFVVLVPIDTEIDSRYIYAGIPAVMLVAGVLLLGSPGEAALGHASLVLLGNASYALYLSHTFAVNAVLWVATHTLDHVPPGAFLAVASLASIATSVLVYLLIEQPLLRLLKPRYQAFRNRQRLASSPSSC